MRPTSSAIVIPFFDELCHLNSLGVDLWREESTTAKAELESFEDGSHTGDL